MSKLRSKCHNAPVTVSSNFYRPKKNVTMFYVCLKCKEACDLKEEIGRNNNDK